MRVLERLENKMELILTSRVLECLIGQEEGRPQTRIELRFSAEVQTRSVKQYFSAATLRVIPFAGPYDQRPGGEIVQGIIRVLDQDLEVSVLIPEQATAALLSTGSNVNQEKLVVAVWPFESVDEWDGKAPLLVRQARFQCRISSPTQ